MKNKRLWFRLTLVIVGVLVVFMILVLPDLVTKKTIGPRLGGSGAEEIVQDFHGVLYKDSKYRTFYGGMYVSGDDVVILVTRKYRKATPEVKEFLKEQDGIVVKKCKYTLLELQELQEEIWDKRDELAENANGKQKEFLNRLVTSGTYQHKNCLHIGIKDMTFADCIRFRIMFGLVGDYRVEFESVGGVFLD